MWDLIVSVPDQCLYFYFVIYWPNHNLICQHGCVFYASSVKNKPECMLKWCYCVSKYLEYCTEVHVCQIRFVTYRIETCTHFDISAWKAHWVNSYLPNALLHPYQLDESISSFIRVWTVCRGPYASYMYMCTRTLNTISTSHTFLSVAKSKQGVQIEYLSKE